MLTVFNLTDSLIQEIEKSKFSEKKSENEFCLNLVDEKVYYINAPKVYVEDIKSDDWVCLFVNSDQPVSIFLIFYDKEESKISAISCQNYKKEKINIPSGTYYCVPALRLKNNEKIKSLAIHIGSELEINKIVNEKFKFNCDALQEAHKNTFVIFMETMFCDQEKSEIILDRYFSYLKTQILYSIRWLCDKNDFFWVIHISKDKIKYIEQLNAICNGISNIFINIYDHNDFETKVTTNVDLIKKSNLFGDNYEKIFSNFLDENSFLFSNKIVVRFGLDDDDFILENHINKIKMAVNYFEDKLISNDEIFIGFTDIAVAYHDYYGGCNVEEVLLRRCMTGNRMTVSYSKLPVSPFSISEDFYKDRKDSNKYFVFETKCPSFIYNRHGFNLSKYSKNGYYQEILNEKYFENKFEFTKSYLK